MSARTQAVLLACAIVLLLLLFVAADAQTYTPDFRGPM